jgi:PAS domain S-box-containing protein
MGHDPLPFSRTTRIDLTGRSAHGGDVAPAPNAAGAPAGTLPGTDELLFQRLYDAALVTDAQGRVLRANPRAFEQLGYSTDEFAQHAVSRFLPGVDRELLGRLRPALEQGNFALIQGYARRKDGHLFPIEVSVLALDDGMSRLCFCLRDITLRKEAEDQLRTGFAALQNSSAGVLVLDPEGAIVYANPAAARLWAAAAPGEMARTVFADWFEDARAANDLLSRLDREAEWTGDLCARRADGSVFTVFVAAAPNLDAENARIGTVVSLIDVTAERQAEQALRDAERNRAMLASLSAACHHLAQPATVLVGNMALLQDDPPLASPDREEALRGSKQAADELLKLIHRLNRVAIYRTTPYLPSTATTPDPDMILDIRP